MTKKLAKFDARRGCTYQEAQQTPNRVKSRETPRYIIDGP